MNSKQRQFKKAYDLERKTQELRGCVSIKPSQIFNRMKISQRQFDSLYAGMKDVFFFESKSIGIQGETTVSIHWIE